jgi:HK97 gp10 family phage protein
VEVKIVGMDKLLKKLAALPKRTTVALDGVLSTAAEQIEDGVESRAPVDSGDLVEGVKSEKVVDSDTRVVYEVRGEAPHTRFVEFGTADQEANPMFRPAVDENVGSTFQRAKQAVRRALR